MGTSPRSISNDSLSPPTIGSLSDLNRQAYSCRDKRSCGSLSQVLYEQLREAIETLAKSIARFATSPTIGATISMPAVKHADGAMQKL